MKFVVDDCMDAILEDTQLSGNVMLRYSSVCPDDVMNLGNDLMCGDGDWPSLMGIVFQTLPATVEFSSSFLHHAT